MKSLFLNILILSTSTLFCTSAYGQAENVPVGHPVYVFLKRLEVKGLIERYHDAVLPLSRRDVATFLDRIKEKRNELTSAERTYLEDYQAEFQHSLSGETTGIQSLISSSSAPHGGTLGDLFSPREKFLYALVDSNLSFFVNGLLNLDIRRRSGDNLGGEHAEYLQFGARIRGTVYNRLGYYLHGTNAQFWGSRELLQQDPVVGQAFTLGVTNAKNFDFVEGYVRYDGGIVSAQVGRERLLWGTGYDEKMIASDNVRVFDFIRADAEYKSLKYSFIHGWLLGKRSNLIFTLPPDTSTQYSEPVVADKYFAAHRLEFSFPGLFDIGGQEMVIYSNRSPDLAFLNPVTLIESAQRSREERDNVLWAFDIQTHFIPNVELSGTFLLDDLNFPDLFTDVWSNRFAYQAGMFYVEPFTLGNTSLMVEYTRVEPYVFAHNRSRENDYGSGGRPLGTRIGPNADSWFVRGDYLPMRNLHLSFRVRFVRHGMNEVDPSGNLIRNVGGDFLQPHRDTDPQTKVFLDGILTRTRTLQFVGSYEFVHQLWAELFIAHEEKKASGTTMNATTVEGRLRWEI